MSKAESGNRPGHRNKPVPHLSFSHLGFYVFDLARMEDFYTRVLGFVVSDRGVVRGSDLVFLSRDAREHHQIVLVDGRRGRPDGTTINQISFRLAGLADLRVLYEIAGNEQAVTDLMAIDHGTAWSVYFRDPEGNRVELFVDSPWYVPQPVVEPLDLSLSDAEIRRRTEARHAADTGFRPIEQWRAEFGENPGVSKTGD